MYKTPIKIFYRPEMSFKDTSNKQFSINRDKPRLFVEYLQKSELKDSIEIVQNREKIDDKDLLLGHTQEYLSDFFSADPRIEASIGIKLTPEYLESTKYEVSTLYHAIKYALQYPETITHSLACWFHHAWPTGGRMLCGLNGQVIASCKIYQELWAKGVYIDLDHHYWNAIDESRWFNDIIDKAIPPYWNINPEGEHQHFLSDLKQKLNTININEVDYIVYCHWVDSCEWDVFGGKLTEDEWLECTRMVLGFIKEQQKKIPIILALFGGYRNKMEEMFDLYKKDLFYFM